ncbi:MAG: Gfo/Idh/MocA family oxidoreductase [Phycisphaerae bacterium]|nr:Gfo/Idh/MocA family oxidoreductase [Phycisphaerae bacterium]
MRNEPNSPECTPSQPLAEPRETNDGSHADRISVTRRSFVAAGVAAGAATLLVPKVWGAQAGKAQIKVGLIGCGGRGTGAAAQALSAGDDVVLWAAGDMFPDRVASCLKHLSGHAAKDRATVPEDRQFSGFDSYQKVIDSGVDVVLLCTAPHFRPMHLKAAVDAGKQIFCEKPFFVDAPGYRSVLESVQRCKEKKLNFVSGFCWRYSGPERAFFAQVLDDDTLGVPMAMYSCYYTGPLGVNKRKPGWTDMELQLRNWQHFNWLSGDIIVEQACHSIDKINWAMRNVAPASAVGMGGRQTRESIPERGDVYDHFSIVYTYPDGRKAFLNCRQQADCYFENTDWIAGTKGQGFVNGWGPTQWIKDPAGKVVWKYDPNTTRVDMYQQEHNELFAAIREGKVVNDGDWACTSCMMAVLGRMAAYSGQQVTWDSAIASTESLAPAAYQLGDVPMPEPKQPGKYRVQ